MGESVQRAVDISMLRCRQLFAFNEFGLWTQILWRLLTVSLQSALIVEKVKTKSQQIVEEKPFTSSLICQDASVVEKSKE